MKNMILTILIIITANLSIYSANKENEVVITGTYMAPESFTSSETIRWDSKRGSEYLEIIINGKILDFEIVSLHWENDNLAEKSQKFTIKKIENKTIILVTSLPEGLPSERIKWKDYLLPKTFDWIILKTSCKLFGKIAQHFLPMKFLNIK